MSRVYDNNTINNQKWEFVHHTVIYKKQYMKIIRNVAIDLNFFCLLVLRISNFLSFPFLIGLLEFFYFYVFVIAGI